MTSQFLPLWSANQTHNPYTCTCTLCFMLLYPTGHIFQEHQLQDAEHWVLGGGWQRNELNAWYDPG